MKRALLYFVIFAAIQVVAGGIVMFVYLMMKGKGTELDATGLMATTVLTDVITLVCFLWPKWAELSPNWLRTRQWGVCFLCALAALGAILPSMYIQELMPELPNYMEDEFELLLSSRFGYIILGLMAPMVEEIVFRGAILRALLRWKRNPWVGILISAVLFSAIHMNPAQMPHAFLIGILLGWMYYRTDSILPGVIYHWVNNSMAYLMYAFYPDPNIKLIDVFIGSQRTILMAVAFSLCILLPSLFQLNLRMKK